MVEAWDAAGGNAGGASILIPGGGRRGRRWEGGIGSGANWWLIGEILLLIAEKPSHGYELMNRLRDFGIYLEGVGQMGNIYRILSELEVLGFIRSNWETIGPGPARKIYEITPEGKFHLKRIAHSAETFRDTLDTFIERCSKIL